MKLAQRALTRLAQDAQIRELYGRIPRNDPFFEYLRLAAEAPNSAKAFRAVISIVDALQRIVNDAGNGHWADSFELSEALAKTAKGLVGANLESAKVSKKKPISSRGVEETRLLAIKLSKVVDRELSRPFGEPFIRRHITASKAGDSVFRGPERSAEKVQQLVAKEVSLSDASLTEAKSIDDVKAHRGDRTSLPEAPLDTAGQPKERELGQALQTEQDNTNTGDSPTDPARYPNVQFYHYGDADTDAVSVPNTHTIETPVGRRLEFHFWIGSVKDGIRSVDDFDFNPTADNVYPIDTEVQVWSDRRFLDFEKHSAQLSIPKRGASEHARFVVHVRDPHWTDGEFFLFLMSGGEVFGCFLIRARFRSHSLPESGAQSFQDIFLSSKYFRFRERPGISALTLLLTKRAGPWQLFTLKPNEKPWASVAISETLLNESNRDIYRQCTQIALGAASREQDNGQLTVGDPRFAELAEKGWVLFNNLFTVQGDAAARDFVLSRLLSLPEGSRVTITMDEDAWQLVVPWGLLYVDKGFRDLPFSANLNGFLGYRYNVVVRPATTPVNPVLPRQRPIRMGAAWLTRTETAQLEENLRSARAAGALQVDRIVAQDGSLPALKSEEFDLLHFYCHGHTRYPDSFNRKEFVQLLRDHSNRLQRATSGPEAEVNELAAFLKKVAPASDSLMMLDGGFVYRSDLGNDLAALKGAPIVLLSMCESAQVTPSGSGFVTFFLQRGARAAVGTEGPTLWTLGRDLDTQMIDRLLKGQTVGEAFYETKRGLAAVNALALVYSLWGDSGARLPVS